jgi:hypothetical protein
MYKYITEQGKKLQQKPYTPYSGELVAPLNDIQKQAISQIQQYGQTAQPYYNEAAGMTRGVAAGLTPEGYQQGVQGYMSPFLQNAVGATVAQLNNVNQQQQNQLAGNAITQGAFGGDRSGIARGNLINQQNLAMGQTIGQMEQQGYQNAAANYMAGLGQTGQMAQQLANLGLGGQQAGLAGAQAIGEAGTIPYNIAQAEDAAKYGQFAQGQAYPIQMLGFLANMASGLGAGQGGTTSTTQPGPSPFSQLLGFGTAIAGLPWSDRRLKENVERVGETYDGQPIYSYNYKGDQTPQIGLMAQEVEKHHPDAVGLAGGFKTVDYKRATQDAADRGHFALGGTSQGGLVPSDGQRMPYATFGAVPYEDDPLYQLEAKYMKTPVVSYVPDIKISGSAPSFPKPVEADTSGGIDTKGLSAISNIFSKVTNPYSNLGSSRAANQFAADQAALASGLGAYDWSDPSIYAPAMNAGGLVPRTHHASGDDSPQGSSDTVPADQGPMSLIERVAGHPFSDEARSGILAAGLGMLASRSPFPGVAIGEGGLSGLNTYYNAIKNKMEQQKAISEMGLQGAQTKEQEALAIAKPQEVQQAGQRISIEQKANALKQYEYWRSLFRPVPGGYLDMNGQIIPDQEFAARQKQTMEKLGLGFGDVAPVEGAARVGPATTQTAPAAPAAPGAAAPATTTAPAAPPAAIDPARAARNAHLPSEDELKYTRIGDRRGDVNPNFNVPDDYNFINPDQWTAIVRNPDVLKGYQSQAFEDKKTSKDQAAKSYSAQYLLNNMERDVESLPDTGLLQMGPNAPQIVSYATNIDQILTTIGAKPLFEGKDLAAAQDLMKDSTKLGFELTNTLGSREAAAVVKQATAATPGIQNTKLGFQRILAALREGLNYDQDYHTFLDQYVAKKGYSEGAEELFRKQNPPELYSARAILSTIPEGEITKFTTYLTQNRNNPNAVKHLVDQFDAEYGKGTARTIFGLKYD